VAHRQEPTTPADVRASSPGDDIDELEGEPMARAEQVAAERLDEARLLLAERAEEARQVLAERARTGGTELATWARGASADLAGRAGPVLAERAEQAKGDLQRRWQELEEELPVDLETVVPQLERGFWQMVRAVLGVLMIVPRLLLRALRGFGTLADDVSARGLVMGERAREVVAAVPPSKRVRRQRRWRTAAWTGAGFGVGLFVGWLLGRREQDMVTYEPAELGSHLEAVPVPPGPVATPLDTTDDHPPVAPPGDVPTEGADEPEELDELGHLEAAPVPPGPVAAPLDDTDALDVPAAPDVPDVQAAPAADTAAGDDDGREDATEEEQR
jgi:hypothetical protein